MNRVPGATAGMKGVKILHIIAVIGTILALCVGIACLWYGGYLFGVKSVSPKDAEEMQELIERGCDAFTAWLDDQDSRTASFDDPFGKKSQEMLQALSKMNDMARRRKWR